MTFAGSFFSSLSSGGAGLILLPVLLFTGLPFINALASHKLAVGFILETAVDRFVQDTSIGLVADFALGSTSPFGCRSLRSPGHAPRGARLRYNSLE